MDKQQLQQAIILADKKAQRKKRQRLYKFISFFTVCSFLLLRKINPGSILGDVVSAIFLGSILGFLVPVIIAAYQGLSGIKVSYPEDCELQRLSALYEEMFGENFGGPWSR